MKLDRVEIGKLHDLLGMGGEILISSHMRPDPDAIGSVLALREMVETFGGRPVCILEDDCPTRCLSLPGAKEIRTARELGQVSQYSRVIVVDSGSRTRIGIVEQFIATDALVANLDHHISNTRFGAINLVDTDAAASGELLFDLCHELQVKVTKSLATNMLAGVLTDTGRFRHSNTSPRSLQIAAELVEAGADISALTEQLYYAIPEEDVRATGRILDTLQMHANGRISTMHVPVRDSVEDPDNIIDIGRAINGVEVAVLLSEMKDGRIRASLRSNSYVNVSEIAAAFGGGGHERAAGFRMSGTIESVERRLLPRLEAALTKAIAPN
ncbi:bifunctional oligoribonuclease/PAP phosphatase NrnA [bacterium]|nr:bifunctional oligoribonuclease/PAP phosphatase NrnA [bacterium]